MFRFLLIIVIAIFLLPVSTLAEDSCQFDFSNIIPMLQAATTLDAVAEARAQIELQEAQCSDRAPDSAGDSRTNPVPYGMAGVALARDFDATIQLIGYVDDGETVLLNANSRNDPAPDGKRYVLVAFQFACDRNPNESCEYSRFQFSIVGDKGIAYDWESVDLRSGSISDDQEIFGGGSVNVGVAFLVDDDDSNFVLFTEYGKPRTYFATE